MASVCADGGPRGRAGLSWRCRRRCSCASALAIRFAVLSVSPMGMDVSAAMTLSSAGTGSQATTWQVVPVQFLRRRPRQSQVGPRTAAAGSPSGRGPPHDTRDVCFGSRAASPTPPPNRAGASRGRGVVVARPAPTSASPAHRRSTGRSRPVDADHAELAALVAAQRLPAGLAEAPRRPRREAPETAEARRGARPLLNRRGAKYEIHC